MNFLASSRASRKPSATNMISQINSKSGTTIAHGLNTAPHASYILGNIQQSFSSVMLIKIIFSYVVDNHVIANRCYILQNRIIVRRLYYKHDTVSIQLCWYQPEKRFEVLGQLCSSGVARVHCDEDPNRRRQRDVFRQEVEDGFLLSNGVLDTLHLDSDDRQDFNRDSVELVETSPRTGLCETFVDVANWLYNISTCKHSNDLTHFLLVYVHLYSRMYSLNV